jgi:invasion protein IalB
LHFVAVITTALIAIGVSGAATAADIPGFTVHTPWKKVCFNSRKTDFKRLCDTRAEARKHNDHSLLAAVELVDREGEARKILRVTFPLGMQLRYGTRLIVYGADAPHPQEGPFVTCTAAGCTSDYEATSKLLGIIRAGQALIVQAIDQTGKPFSATLSLGDFRVAYDSPWTEPITDEIVESREVIEKPLKPWLDDTLRPELRPPMR